MSILSKILDQAPQYLALAAAIVLLINEIQQIDPASTLSYVIVGGAVSLLYSLVSLTFPSFSLFISRLFSESSSPLLMLFVMSSIICYAMIFLVYTLFKFSREAYNEWKQISPDLKLDSDHKIFLLNLLGAIGSLGILAVLLRKAYGGIIYAFMFLLYTPYMLFLYLQHNMK